MKIDCYSEPEIIDIVYKEISRRNNIMNKTQLRGLIKQEITEQSKKFHGELFDLRKEIRRLNEEIKILK